MTTPDPHAGPPSGALPAREQLPEGEEAPPAGVRAMSIVRWALVAVMACVAAGSWISWARAGAQVESDSRFHCPMHPTVLQQHQGECPICGMDLVPVSEAAAASAPAVEGKGAQGSEAAGSQAGAAAGRFWCPMHPEVLSDDPEARCAKCGGMKLLPREPAAEKKYPPVPGLATVEVAPERAQAIGVRTERVRWAAIARRVRAAGTIGVDESRVAVVASRVTGWVDDLRVHRTGARVERGQVLGTIEPAGKPGASVPFRSPIAGYVSRKIDAPGVYVEPGTELFRIADLSTVTLMVEVSERDSRSVRAGQRVTFIPAAGSGETYEGKVDLVYPALDPASRMQELRIVLENPSLALRPGMSGDAVIDLDVAEGLTIPREALVDTGDRQYVFVARGGGHFEPRLVRADVRGHDHVLVLDGVAEGERVVTTANFMIDAESRVRAAVRAFTR